ncbi:hypothetical protein N7468_009475 [Penicillium chermesinum]|uniref:Sec20 C-terminal domain-containing protein n=1 Tax=Penicillium chermesinum TaxID=63820 RepID=A0A9W9NI68_9EURO|nr:uncharacterized protein N7468_009475 [Penicillium chermesinum]KAJ5220271.1 hypothetical protein N7468_009475 [Penicillium chermesinum]
MSTPTVLQARLKELSTNLGKIQPLINQLRNFSPSIDKGDEVRLELGSEIHAGLKDAEEELELLRIDVDALGPIVDNRRKVSISAGEKDNEKERVISLAERLEQDLKKTRSEFRNAQLQAKRQTELARRKERELLLSRSQPSERQRPSEKLTQDDLVLNASSDVTAALRRTHQLLQAEVSRSKFAQETLEQSTAAISSLSESYSSLDTLLASSRSLASSLLRSQKSDTWYLETAFYILLGTIAWLVFRRILYGPLWWLVWIPFQLIFRVFFAVLSAVGLSGASKEIQPSSRPIAVDISATIQQAATAVTAITSGNMPIDTDQPSKQDEADRLIDKIGRMVYDNEKQGHYDIDDLPPRRTAAAR